MASLQEYAAMQNAARGIGEASEYIGQAADDFNKAQAAKAEKARMMEIAAQAAELYKTGDLKGAAAVLMKGNPQLANDVFKSLTTEKGDTYEVGVPGKPGESELHYRDRMEDKVLGPGIELAKARSKPGSSGTYQVINPRTGEREIRDRATGELITIVGKAEAEADQDEFDPKQLYKMLSPRQMNDYKETQQTFFKDSKADREGMVAAQNITQSLAEGKKLNGDVLRAFQNQFATAMGEGGRRTEEDVAPFGGKADVLSRLARTVEIGAKGTLPESDRQFLTGLAQVLVKINERAILQKATPFSKALATKSTLTEDQARNLLIQGLVTDPTLEETKKKAAAKKASSMTEKSMTATDKAMVEEAKKVKPGDPDYEGAQKVLQHWGIK